MRTIQLLLAVTSLLVLRPAAGVAQEMFEFQDQSVRWISPENRNGAPGQGGRENAGAKGHPYDTLRAGQSLVLGEIAGSGVIRRMWITVSDRSPVMLRSLRLDMYWDGAERPAVSVPLGDFFGAALGQLVPFESALFSSPEGRSFNTIVPMPFRRSARIVLTNESDRDLPHVFYDIDYTLGTVPRESLYFHASWRRERPTTLGSDFRVLPRVSGRGRYLGSNIGIITDQAYASTWWGEGEMRVFLDSDHEHPTLAGTGAEDYIGTGWGEGAFTHAYQGAPVADPKQRHWSFYRLHVPDPIFFTSGCEVTLQQIGGGAKAEVLTLLRAGVELRPVTIDPGGRDRFAKLLERTPAVSLDDAGLPDGWVNFYRHDDVSATAYFYLDRPMSDLPPLAAVATRVAGLQ